MRQVVSGPPNYYSISRVVSVRINFPLLSVSRAFCFGHGSSLTDSANLTVR
ncbi:uncharacterized protein PHALS_03646 [Plasmopara halstedii]|uniref:Uncharacterized protein n=1 Tax=Plasmopara halstedii TaxID=4781 RepID=A0A0P1B0G6_PLAHL|nr:uncharacterized protein PHALS_03646 [Plasmopara halstedii]CEG46978.1 hypothetical protein PHALS_03646 [Plasmopara halstedii]|eukprot:XP_024583347.1 hypothetical protein PHALS_03646 [Plasmopara halstedii]